jgi:hypothetical protein
MNKNSADEEDGYSRASLGSLWSVGYVMSAGVRVASMMSLPLGLNDGGQLHPAVFRIEFATKGQIEIGLFGLAIGAIYAKSIPCNPWFQLRISDSSARHPIRD